MLFKRFVIPPMVAVPLRGAIEDGIDQPTDADAASLLSAIEIQKIAQTGSVVNMARPSSMPKTSTVVLALGKGQHALNVSRPLASLPTTRGRRSSMECAPESQVPN